MKKLLAALAILAPALALGQGVAYKPLIPEHTLLSWHFNVAAATGTCPATGTGCAGHVLPARSFTVAGVATYVSVVSGGGAANTTIRVSDGSNNCDCNLACNTVTNSTGAKRATCTGTCTFAPGALLTVNVQTAGCTTTQPTLRNVDIVGKWN